MTMEMRHARFCRTCHNALHEQGSILLKTYVDICSQYVMGKRALVKSQTNGAGSTMIKYLESHGYVISTETSDDLLSIKPCGHIYDEVECVHEFCANRKQHLKSGDEC